MVDAPAAVMSPEQADSPRQLTSGVIPMIYEYLGSRPGCHVVDIGTVTSRKFAVFSHNKARVFFDTTGRSLLSRGGDDDDTWSFDADSLQTLLNSLPQTIDVLLLWDLLDHVTLDDIEVLSKDLRAKMSPGALIYCIVSQQALIPRRPAFVDVVGTEQLSIVSGPLEKEAPRYSPKLLESRFTGFRIEKLYLLQNGSQEHLFSSKGIRQ